MLTKPMDVLTAFPVRKSKKQKQAFRDAVQVYAADRGLNCTIEKGSMGVHNIVIGNPGKAKFLVTAHYDTPARLPFPNLITPCNFWAFMGYQLFTVVVMYAFVFVCSFLTMLVTGNEEISFFLGYLSLWIFLILMMVGPANPTNANDNTSGVVTVLEITRTLPEIHRDKVCFVLFDMEEAGLLGSSAYRKAHKKETEEQIILNLDCVGDGNEIIFFPTKKLKKDAEKLNAIKHVGGWFGEKHISVREKGFSVYPSDQNNFPLGVGIAAFHNKKYVGPYCSRIHTAKDTILEETNVNLLRAALTTIITDTAVQ